MDLSVSLLPLSMDLSVRMVFLFLAGGVLVRASALMVDLPDPYIDIFGDVVFSHVLFRHGSRMPLEFYPNDIYKDSSYWPVGVAQLTDEGKKQEYELGLWLRRRYDHLISRQYDASEIFVQSTDVDRTLMSAQCCMAGLYRPDLDYGWDPEVAWQPIPIHTVPVQLDYLLGAASTFPCATYNTEMNRASNLPEVQALQKKFEPMYDYVSNHTGKTVRDFSAAIRVYDELAIEEQYNMSLPDWVHPIYPEPIKEAGLYSFVLPTWTTLLQRLKVGPLLKEMIEHFQAKRAGSLDPDRNLWVYSAHDATIAAVLNTFKVFDIHFPPYAACMVLELRLMKDEYFVTLFYRNSTVSEPVLLPIKTCSALCPLDQFVSLMMPLLPDVWTQECQLPQVTTEDCFWNAVMVVTGIVGCIIIFILAILVMKKKSRKNYFTMTSPFINFNSKTVSEHLYPLPK